MMAIHRFFKQLEDDLALAKREYADTMTRLHKAINEATDYDWTGILACAKRLEQNGHDLEIAKARIWGAELAVRNAMAGATGCDKEDA